MRSLNGNKPFLPDDMLWSPPAITKAGHDLPTAGIQWPAGLTSKEVLPSQCMVLRPSSLHGGIEVPVPVPDRLPASFKVMQLSRFFLVSSRRAIDKALHHQRRPDVGRPSEL